MSLTVARSHAESQTRSGMSSRGRSTKPRRYTGTGDSDDEVSEGTNKRRKHHNPWSVHLFHPPSSVLLLFLLCLAVWGPWPVRTSLEHSSTCKMCVRGLSQCSMAFKACRPKCHCG